MARPDARGAVSLRVPSHVRRRTHDETTSADDDRPRLRLVVTRGHLGVELDAPWTLGPLVVEELALSLPQVGFPVELSGGVAAFRNKRGRLERLAVAVDGRALHRFARPRLEGIVAGNLGHHVVAPLEDGWLVGLTGEGSALAFEIRVAPLDGDLRFVPVEARGIGLGAPASILASRALFALLKPHGRMVGGAVIVEGAPEAIVRELLPLAGMRVPAAKAMRFTALEGDVEAVTLWAEREGAPLAPTERATRAVELAALVADAEAALLAGRLDEARRAYVEAATGAPRHPEIAARLAALDLAVGGRAEAALSTLSDAVLPSEAGLLGGQLLLAVGDTEGSRAALRRAVVDEPYGPLAGLAWLELASLAPADEAADLLDEAVARAPSLAVARWARFENAIARGQIEQARADLQHLEAHAEGPRARHEVLRRAADSMLAHHAHDEAAAIFERALRHQPDSVEAVAGLAGCFQVLGHQRRALDLLSRAAALAERRPTDHPRVTLALAQALAETADDRPAAIARVRRIESFRPAAFEARLLEARWRAELGDLVGAAVALGRLAEAVEMAQGVLVGEQRADGRLTALWRSTERQAAFYPTPEAARTAVAALLEEGARIQELDCRDLPAARRLLALALRLAPQDRRIAAAFKRVAGTVDRAGLGSAASVPDHELADEVAPAVPVERPVEIPEEERDFGTLDELPDMGEEIRAEQLAEKLRADPTSEPVASELADLLESLGRTHDLLALVSARVEESEGQTRERWEARRQAVLQGLVETARAEGREDEAQLYALMLQRQD